MKLATVHLIYVDYALLAELNEAATASPEDILLAYELALETDPLTDFDDFVALGDTNDYFNS